jgi:two-component system, OmpR family, phosphate regulon response regulator PhoB
MTSGPAPFVAISGSCYLFGAGHVSSPWPIMQRSAIITVDDSGGHVKKLLIADDEPGIRRLIRMTLESDEYEIIEATNGDEALELARLHKPALVLLDVMMPRRGGFEICRDLKADPETASITVVMLTARTQDADQREGDTAGADHYFMKPFSPLALMRKVDEILQQQEARARPPRE